ncbi:MAG TPA: hypothetical protein VGP76_19365 [Planctomycetaceae bacterium]|jgi:hypothetical protein|nr:hypothetical protein [Planctomycetaceae bacterium]
MNAFTLTEVANALMCGKHRHRLAYGRLPGTQKALYDLEAVEARCSENGKRSGSFRD